LPLAGARKKAFSSYAPCPYSHRAPSHLQW